MFIITKITAAIPVWDRSGGILMGLCLGHALAEQQRNAPQSGNTDDGVDDAADGGSLTAANICHKVESEQTHKQPVDGADDRYDKGSTIKHKITPFLTGSAGITIRVLPFLPDFIRILSKLPYNIRRLWLISNACIKR